MDRGEYLFFLYIMRNRRKHRYKRRKVNTIDKKLDNMNQKVKAFNDRLEAKNLERKAKPKKVLTEYQKARLRASNKIGIQAFIYLVGVFKIAFIFPPILLTIPFFCIYIIVKAIKLNIMLHELKQELNKYK